jgi:hypothetical protein
MTATSDYSRRFVASAKTFYFQQNNGCCELQAHDGPLLLIAVGTAESCYVPAWPKMQPDDKIQSFNIKPQRRPRPQMKPKGALTSGSNVETNVERMSNNEE